MAEEKALLDEVAEAVREEGYIDITRSADARMWREEVVELVIEKLRAAGWTVTPP